MEDVRELKELQLDALKEVANIGAGHAAPSLRIAIPGLGMEGVNFITHDPAWLGALTSRRSIDFGLRANLTRGHYHVETHVCHNPTQRFSRRCPAATFAVSEQRTFGGVADLQASALMVTQ